MKSGSWDSDADDDFRPRTSAKRRSQGASGARGSLGFLRLVERSSGIGTGGHPWPGKGGRGKYAGRGCFTRTAALSAQRVVVKTRVVRQGKGAQSLKALRLHLGYLTRPGVELEGDKQARCYDRNGELERGDLDRWAGQTAQDRHHFRLIISPENARQLELRTFTLELVGKMEKDLGTRLDFVAVNHYNTDNPHVHLTLRGLDERGRNLVIGRDYIASGVRNRARELATSWLGHRSELEIRQGISAEITQERFTGLDRELLALQGKNPQRVIDLRSPPAHENSIAAFHRGVQKERLRQLGKLDLARETAPGIWVLDQETERVLRGLSLQNDIIKTMHRHLGRDGDRELVIVDPREPRGELIRGRVLERGVGNELYDERFLVVAGRDHRAYYVPLSRDSELPGREATVGSQVAIRVAPEAFSSKISDRNILELAGENGGVYDQKLHLERAQRHRLPPGVTPEEYLENHLKRLGALQRQGVVRGIGEGRWEIPNDLLEKARELDRSQRIGGRVMVRLEGPELALQRPGPGLDRAPR